MQTVNCRTVKDNRNAECVSEEPIVHTFIYSHQHTYAQKSTHTRTRIHTLSKRLFLAELWKRFECIQIALGNSANAFRKIVPSIVA